MRISRSAPGTHPLNRLLERFSLSRLARLPPFYLPVSVPMVNVWGEDNP